MTHPIHPTAEERSKLWPMLFWGPKLAQRNSENRLVDGIGALVELFFSAITKRVLNVQPQDCVNRSIPRSDRVELARALAKGSEIDAYLGYADCRICGKQLGNRDMAGWGFMWPEKAEHYILDHDVWTPDCGRLLATIRTT